MREAFLASDVGGNQPTEQGGFILHDRTTGELLVERVPAGGRDSIRFPLCPEGTRHGQEILGTFHTHPNTGAGWVQEPSPQDIKLSKRYPETMGPHQFVISAELVYHIDCDGTVSQLGPTSRLLELDPDEGSP